MMRKMSGLLFLLSLVVAFLGPGAAHPTLAQNEIGTSWMCPGDFAGQKLSIFSWPTYLGPYTIPVFEELCDVKVTYDITESNEATLARLREGNPGWDVIVISDFMVAIMADLGLLEPLDFSKIPNFANVSDALKDQEFDPGNVYSVPYQWGTSSVGYNVNKIEGGEITSWEQVFGHDGPVAWPDDPRLMIGIGLLMLGYDPNSTDADEIQEAVDYLIENGSNVVAITGDDGQVLLERGLVDIAIEYSGDIIQLQFDCECDDYAYSFPEEGANIYIDNLLIPVDAPNPELAHAFIDYILDPYVGADISNEVGYATPLQAALDLELIDEFYLTSPIVYPDEEVMSRLFYVKANIEAEELYLDAWDQITIMVGGG